MHTFFRVSRWALLWVLIWGFAVGPVLASESQEAAGEIEFLAKAYGVRVHYVFSHRDFFPRMWRDKAGYVHGQQASLNQVQQALPIIREFMDAYPPDVITQHLTDIFLLGRLEMMGHSIGGTYYSMWLYVLVSPHLSQATVLSTLHHEFSSLLMKSHPFPKEQWEQTNAPGWKYAGGSRNMIEKIESQGKAHNSLSHELFSRGFLVSYGQSCVEDDFNVYAGWLFTRRRELDTLASQYPRIRQKRDLCVEFFKSVSPDFEFKN
ncbi:MAG: hypothetical protein JEZ02_00060 [Desulfatibacillum sp.]|nr:hypothetical protein [Desulfatibacillum sp.]